MSQNILLHGDNTVASRQRLVSLIESAKNKSIELIHLDGAGLDATDLTEALETQSLFESSRLVVIERLHKHRSKKLLKSLLSQLNEAANGAELADVLVWEDKRLTAAQLKKLSHFKSEESKASSALFPFLGTLAPGKQVHMMPAFTKVIETDAVELVFFMMARHVGELIQARDGALKGPSWKIGKLAAQAKHFDNHALEQLLEDLATIDWEIKSGQSGVTLQIRLELLLLSL